MMTALSMHKDSLKDIAVIVAKSDRHLYSRMSVMAIIGFIPACQRALITEYTVIAAFFR